MKCNICDSRTFVDMGLRKNVRCAQCGSLERTRLMWFYIEHHGIDPDMRILHLAPEKGLCDILSARVHEGNYVAADIDPARYRFAAGCVKLDLCDLESQPSNHYDLIIHSHVLEHVPCNIVHPLFHLHRMLKPNGRHVCIIPFMPGEYDECFQEIGDDERTRRFGQFDHVRRFGRDDIARHLGAVLNLPAEFNALEHFKAEDLVAANIPESHWRGFHIGTVLVLGKHDMKLMAQ